jgi:hypothetical protein
MICLSKNLTDRYVNDFARGAKLQTYDPNETFPNGPLLIRGLGKRDLIHQCWQENRTFYYMDSGYFGNFIYKGNPDGYKMHHRIVKNNLQHLSVVDRPNDRWEALQIPLHEWKEKGDYILLVTPSEKPCKFYNIDVNVWIKNTLNQIKKYTDRPVKIRYKAARLERLENTIYDDMKHAWAVVTYNSIAAVEAIQYGVPAFTSAPTAADPVCDKDLSLLETPTRVSDEDRYKWACHLAYGQWTTGEFIKGKAYRMLNEIS